MADTPRIGIIGLPGKWSSETLADAVEAHTGDRLLFDMADVRLDLADNPDKYIQVRCFQDNNGNLALSIGNATPLTVTGVRYIVQYRDGLGIQTRENAVSGQIRPGTAINVSTGIGPYTSGAGCPVQITAARVAE